LTWPGQLARRARVRTMGYGIPSDFELNFGRHLPALGGTGGEATGHER
jgi:hypothetical protein